MSIDDLRSRFRWTADKVDGWRVLDAVTGPLTGDCDDFAITALWIMAGRSMPRMWWLLITMQAAIWHCTTARGEPHAVLWLRGHGWIDNIYPDWSAQARHKRRFPWPWPIIPAKLIMGVVSK